MSFVTRHRMLSWEILLVLLVSGIICASSATPRKTKNNVKSAVFLSPKIELTPGLVSNKFYFDVDFPRGHISIKSFNAELVDEAGNSVPLHETYLHHWVVLKYHQPKNVSDNSQSGIILVRNSGFCQDNVLIQYYGLGSETRGTDTYIPDPFGVEAGNPEEIPKGYEEKWLINVHAIDTRGVEDRLGCTECRCDLYNVTRDENGNPLSPDYVGGLQCCPDDTKCRLEKGFQGPKRSLYLKYTVIWVNWNKFEVPVKIYIPDVTDTVNVSYNSTGPSIKHDCKVDYQVERCRKGHRCVDVKRTSFPINTGGYVIYAGAHQHAGGVGSTLYGQDGRVICTSLPKYGTGKEAGNEEGYIVGMTTCYPKPGSVKILDGETLTLESSYNNSHSHSGVMGLFYFLVAEKLSNQHI